MTSLASEGVSSYAAIAMLKYSSAMTRILNRGLVGHWRLNGDYTDESAQRRTGTPAGDIAFSTDMLGNATGCILINQGGAVNGKVTCSSTNHMITSATGMTVTCWAYRTDDIAAQNRRLFIDATDKIECTVPATNHRPNLTIKDTTGHIPTNNVTAMTINTWYFLAFRYITGSSDVWMNNLIKGTASPGDFNGAIGSGFVIGNYTNSLQGFPGKIDDVRLYNRRLSDAEILILYNSGSVYEREIGTELLPVIATLSGGT